MATTTPLPPPPPIDDRESTPLLFSPKGGGRLDPNQANFPDDGPRRRGGPMQSETHHFASKFDPPSRHNLESSSSSKRKKRTNVPIFQKVISSISSMRETVGPYTKPSLREERKDGKEYYEDNYNDLPWKCSFGTRQDDGIWLNLNDPPGLTMSSMVWLLIGYAGFTVTLLEKNNSLHPFVSVTYCTLCALALASHAKTAFTDPGALPPHAIPTEENGLNRLEFPMCSVCETYKPPKTHHCRICDRCISGMDHHCPWMNNCIGTGNMKHFILFLVYVWVASAYALILFGMNYFLCSDEECTFSNGLVALVRLMTFLCIGALLFTSNMILSVFWGITTGMGTIDRMKKQESDTFDESDDEPMQLIDIFGIGAYYTWLLPVDPLFNDHDRVMRYSSTQRLLREKRMNTKL